jgi:hypothetical protein
VVCHARPLAADLWKARSRLRKVSRAR